MTTLPLPRKTGVVLLTAAAAAAYWAGWGLGILPQDRLTAVLGAGLIAVPVLSLIDTQARNFHGLAGLLLGLCPTAALLILLAQAPDLETVAGRVSLWPLLLSLFAAWLALTLLPGMSTRICLARAGFSLALTLTLAEVLGVGVFADRWVLESPVHLLITFTATLVLAAEGRIAVLGPLAADEARMVSGMTQLLPLLGFAGTVWGIMVALGALPDVFASEVPSSDALQKLLGGLGTAFETTLLGLGFAVAIAMIEMLLPESDPKS